MHIYNEVSSQFTRYCIVEKVHLNRVFCALVVSISDADEFIPLGYITLFANRCVCHLWVCVCACWDANSVVVRLTHTPLRPFMTVMSFPQLMV